MNILVIKQTSLGDVLHSTGHIRTIKQNFPNCRLTLLTAASSADIYRHNPWVDQLILFESYRVKREWRRRPLSTARYLATAFAAVRAQYFDLAFDLQGLAKSALFLYAARAGKKYVKGNWRGFGFGARLVRFRNPALHAIAEMDGVLRCAQLSVDDTTMEFFSGSAAQPSIDGLLAQINPRQLPLLVLSPFTRWRSKDWPLQNYLEIAVRLASEADVVVALTAAAELRPRLAEALPPNCPAQLHNLAGNLSLLQFAELVGRANLLLSGDSFPMHVACAKNTPVVALFAPTDEAKTGPLGAQHQVLRAPHCQPCDRPNCRRDCLSQISTATVFGALTARLAALRESPD